MAYEHSPFVPTHRFSLPETGSGNKRGSIQLFPWTTSSAQEIFLGKWRASDQWSQMTAEFSDALSVGYGEKLYIIHHTVKKPVFCLDLTDPANKADGTPQVAWALRTAYPFDPLVLLAANCRVFVLNVRQRRMIGYIRQNGGRITSIAVKPTSPNIFAITSADFTTRIYNLDLQVEHPKNPVWPPWIGPSQASAAHATDGSDSVGSGLGRCIQILVGGRSGGHAWDVLGAAFHPQLPLIATCGADRHVKIWRLQFPSNERPVREDKPLFSARITTSRVLAIAWLADDVLVMHTATTYTPRRLDDQEAASPGPDEGQEETMYLHHTQHGTIDVFKWFGLKRYFPGAGSNHDPVSRGGASDYQESKAYTVLATESLIPPHNPGAHDQLVEPISSIPQQQMAGIHGVFLFVYPDSRKFVIVEASKLTRRTIPSYSDADDDLYQMTKMTKRIRLDDSVPTSMSVLGRVAEPLPNLESENVEIAGCAIAPSSLILLGSNGTIWILQERS
ncbi:hypothetical protein B0H11DRAFT_2013790 [Mycena galericulata]|nr:hypothetical protein B0H11DRAFT_2013790 [Mycena galericulata]